MERLNIRERERKPDWERGKRERVRVIERLNIREGEEKGCS